MNVFTFATVAAYQAAKVSGGDIYNALNSSSEVSCSTVSYITATGQTLVDAVNVIVDEPYGEIGDVLLDKGGTKYWLKSYAGWNASSLGQTCAITSRLTSAGYTLIGFLIQRQGNEGLICSLADVSSGKWVDISLTEAAAAGATAIKVTAGSGLKAGMTITIYSSTSYGATIASVTAGTSYDTVMLTAGLTAALSAGAYVCTNSFDGCTTMGSIRRNNFSYGLPKAGASFYDTWIAGPSAAYAEKARGSEPYTYTWPVPRTVWDAMMAKVNANESGSSSFSGGSWTVTAGSGKATASLTYTAVEGSVTIDPSTYGYNFDTWYYCRIQAQYPASAGALSDMNGRGNTRAMIKSGLRMPLATACNAYTRNVTGFSAGDWWMPSAGEMALMMIFDGMLTKKGVAHTSNYYWTSTARSGLTAWNVDCPEARVNYGTQFNGRAVRAFSAYHFQN